MSGTLYQLLMGRGKLDSSRKIRIYKTVLRPIVTYASPLWAIGLTSHMNKLQMFQERIQRMALNLSWFIRNTTLHEDVGVAPLMDFIRKIRFFDRVMDRWNRLVSASQEYDPGIPWSRVTGSSGSSHEVETTFPPRRKHNTLESMVDRVAESLDGLLQDGKEKNAKPTALKRTCARAEDGLSSWTLERVPLRWRS
ncbi:hypothetical protein Trydic_g23355 [Trypoxylus dichotomus]